jgi:uncharacterized phage-like protein YoqJ
VDDIKVDLENEILAAVQDGYSSFITGMACGTDIWAGNIVLRLKDRFPDLKLIAAVPFPEVAACWPDEWKQKYHLLLSRADWVQTICPEYCAEAYRLRNRWMVDHASRIIAVYDGKPGGTENTIRYARQAGITVVTLNGA